MLVCRRLYSQAAIVNEGLSVKLVVRDGIGRLFPVISLAMGVAEMVVPRYLGSDVPACLDAYAMIFVEKRHLPVLFRISFFSECLRLSEKSTIVDNRLIDEIGISVNAKPDLFGAPTVKVVGSHLNALPQRCIDACRKRQVHEVVLMAQVLVFGIVCCREIHLCTDGYALMDISAHSTSQRISVPMLVSGIVGCALHNVERHPGGIDECRPAHLFARKIVIPHLSVHHDTVSEPIERLHASSNVHRLRRLVETAFYHFHVVGGRLALRENHDVVAPRRALLVREHAFLCDEKWLACRLQRDFR